MNEFIVSLLAGAFSALAGGLAASDLIRKLVFQLLGKKAPAQKYSERLADLTGSLTKASSEVDAVLQEMARVAKERERSVRDLEKGLLELETQEKEMKERITALQSVPIPVAEYFAKLVEPVEKKSARRDYLLFVSGVIVTTIIAIGLRRVFGI